MVKLGSRYLSFRRSKHGRLIVRLAKDERGAQMVEIALGIVLMAAVAGFGLVLLGGSLGKFFTDAGNAIGSASVPTAPPT